MAGIVRTILLMALPPVAVLAAYAISTVGVGTEAGRVPIPGERVVHLEKGTIALSYEERRNLEEGNGTIGVDDADFLEIPADLEVRVHPRGGGGALELNRTAFGSVTEDDAGARKVFANVDVQRSGRYTVVTKPIATEAPDPAVTLGEDVLANFLPWGIRALAACGLGGLLAGALALLGRLRQRAYA